MTDTLAAALGHGYRVERELGQGGMATVYLAYDLKHERRVAVKVLRSDLAAVIGAERFLREIKTIATLQHPHILGLIDSGQVGATAYYVMPFVEGESLRDRLRREKQLPIAEAVQIATEVAGALDYAHRHGIVHRDIKPENVLLHDGAALVADFGIALAVSKGGESRMTETGMSLGTPHYMSPEQAMGEREITARSDVYALGAMTYEMLVGDPPFTGSTAQAIVAKVMTERPRPIHPQRDTVPPAVEDAVLTALEKLPADRFATAAQYADALHAVSDTGRTRISPALRRGSRPGWRARASDPVVWTLAALTIAAMVLSGWVWQRTSSPSTDVTRFTIPAPPSGRTNALGYNVLSVSADGRTLVYVGQGDGGHQQLLLRTLDNVVPKPLPGTEDATSPLFSPDGRWVAFIRSNQLYKIALDASAPQLLGTAPGTFNGASWSATGVLVVSGNTALFTIPDGGGPARRLVAKPVPGELYRDAPLVVDAGRSVIYSSWSSTSLSGARIAIASLESGEVTVLDLRGAQPLAYVDGTLLYVTSGGVLMGVPVDLAKRRVRGTPVQVVDNVSVNVSTGLAVAAASRSTLFYQSGSQLSRVVEVGASGPSRTILGNRREYAFPRLSPDGRRLAITLGTSDRRDIWLAELGSGTFTRLTTEGTTNERPEWSPDGSRVLYRTDQETRTAIWWRPADLSSAATPLLRGGGRVDVFEAVLSPDARAIVYQLDTAGADIFYRHLTGDTTPRPVANSQTAIEHMMRLSPDGRWIAFVTDESGRSEVVVQPFPGPGARIQVSVTGGTEPVWSRDGRRLFYRGDGMLMAATVRPAPIFTVTARDPVLRDDYLFASNPHANYDVMPDGSHFIFLQGDTSGELTVVSNWDAVVRARMAAGP